MYFRLNDKYKLVGWNDLPTGILDTSTGDVSFFSTDIYGILLHMNGLEDINPGVLTEEQSDIINSFIDSGMIIKSDRLFPDTHQQLYNFYDNNYIKSVQWGLTGRCNYNCRHCFLSAPENKTEDLTTAECLDIIKQISSCGIYDLSLTGGEFLLRDDLPELIKACSHENIRITKIYTNGALLNTEFLTLLTETNQHPDIQLSYDGIGWHDWVRGVDGAQQIAEKALQTAYEAGFKTSVSMGLFKDNVPVIKESVNLLVSLHVDSITISPIKPLGVLWGKNYPEKTLSDEEYLDAILDYIPSFFESGKPCDLKMGGYFEYFKDKDFFTSLVAKNPESPVPVYPCTEMAYNLFITSEGTVLPCMEFAGNPEYDNFPNLLQFPLKKILQKSVLISTAKTHLEDIYVKNEKCRQCPEKGKHCGEVCRTCADPDFYGIDYHTCNFVRNGWFTKIQKAVEKNGGKYKLL